MEKLHREYTFKGFLNAIRFVNLVADLAEKRDHHPDITINYNKVTFTFWTHTTNNVTEKDARLAAEIDDLFRANKKELA